MVQSGGEFLYIGVAVDSEKPSDTNHQWLRTKVMSSITFPGFCVKSRLTHSWCAPASSTYRCVSVNDEWPSHFCSTGIGTPRSTQLRP